MESDKRWRVRLIGRPSAVDEEGRPVTLARMRAWGILASLLIADEAIEKEVLEQRFWPEQEKARQNLDRALSDLRNAFGRKAIITEDRLVGLARPEDFKVDLNEIDALLADARHRLSPRDRLAPLEKASGLARGEALAGIEGEDGWHVIVRNRIESQTVAIHREYALALEQVGNVEAAFAAVQIGRTVVPTNRSLRDLEMRLSLGLGFVVPTTRTRKNFTPEAVSIEAALSVFAGPFLAEQAIEILGVTARQLEDWTDKGLLSHQTGRFSVPALRRESLWSRLKSEQREYLESRHAKYFANLAQSFRPTVPTLVPDPHPGLEDQAELRVAWYWHVRHADPTAVRDLLEALNALRMTDVCRIGRDWCRAIVGSVSDRRRTLWLAGVLSITCHEFVVAADLLRQAASAPGHPSDSIVLNDLAFALHHSRKRQEALKVLEQAAGLASEEESDTQLAVTLRLQSEVLRAEGRYPEALEIARRVLARDRRVNRERLFLAESLFQSATLRRLLGRRRSALREYEESLSIRIEEGNSHGIADCLRGIALIQARTDFKGQAWANATLAKEIYLKLGKRASYAASLIDLAKISTYRNQPTEALDLLEESLAIWREEGHSGWISVVESLIDEGSR